MTRPATDPAHLGALIGSRICHDLVSPLGAIGNGLELLTMAGAAPGPEMALIAESVQNATARLGFFRVAFGSASPGQSMARAEIVAILEGIGRSARQQIAWEPPGELPRERVKLAFLCLQCLESALPWGGRITVAQEGEHWRLAAEAERIRKLPDLWRCFDDPGAAGDPGAANLQFLLAPVWAAATGQRLWREGDATRLGLAFGPARNPA